MHSQEDLYDIKLNSNHADYDSEPDTSVIIEKGHDDYSDTSRKHSFHKLILTIFKLTRPSLFHLSRRKRPRRRRKMYQINKNLNC